MLPQLRLVLSYTPKVRFAQSKWKFRYLANSQPRMSMEATFVVRKEELTPDWLEQFKSQFSEEIIISITAISLEKPLSVEEQRTATQREMFKRMQEARKKYPPKKIPVDIDINKMIDEMYWEGNH